MYILEAVLKKDREDTKGEIVIRIINILKEKAVYLKNEIAVLYYAYKNPGTPLMPKIIIFFTIGYALSPVDLIPDFIPVLGYLDDLVILPALITLSIRLIPKNILLEAREDIKKQPPQLKKNWFFAIFFVFIWIIILFISGSALTGFFPNRVNNNI